MSISENPYASPEAAIEPQIIEEGEFADVERVRREYLSHETSIRSIGTLYFFGVIFLAMMAIGFAQDNQPVLVILTAMMAGAMIPTGLAIRKLRPWSRIPVGILATVGLLAFGLGTIINGYILYLLFCRKGRVIFSPAYAEVIRQTPHIKYRTSILVKVLFGMILFFMFLAAVSFLLAPLTGR